MTTTDLTERRGLWVYEACRLEAIASRRPIVPEPFVDRDAAFKRQFWTTIERVCADGYQTTPEKEHESWMAAYEAMGWRYGPVRDPLAKTHPDMLPFDDLGKLERDKDAVFLAICDIARRFIRQ